MDARWRPESRPPPVRRRRSSPCCRSRDLAGRTAPSAEARAEQLDLAAAGCRDAPGRGSYARMMRDTVVASLDQSMRVIARSTLGA